MACCGKGGQGGASGGGQGGGSGGAPGGYGGAQGPAGGKRCVSSSHKEDICHGTNERRRDLIAQVKIFLDDFDDRPCPSAPTSQDPNAPRPLGDYKEYLKKHCQSWMPDPPAPTITSTQAHEVRVTAEYEKMKNSQTEYLSFKDAGNKPLVLSCECAKRNGLQDQCSEPECTPPTPQCLATNPGPCCPPSMGLKGQKGAGAQGQGGACDIFMNSQKSGNALEACESVYQHDFRPPPKDAPAPRGCHQNKNAAPQQAACCGRPQNNVYIYTNTQPPPPTNTPSPKTGQQMICFCALPPSAMPPGEKYLCCPQFD